MEVTIYWAPGLLSLLGPWFGFVIIALPSAC